MTTEYLLNREQYAWGFRKYLESLIRAGLIDEADALNMWEHTSAVVEAGGVGSNLPYYQQIARGETYQVPPTYPRALPARGAGATTYEERYAQYTAQGKEAQAQAQPRPGETTLQRLRRMETWLPQAIRVSVRPTEKSPHPWLLVYRTIQGIKRGLGVEGVALEEAYPAGKFEEVRAGVVGARPWTDWFESKYSRELGRFRAVLPYEEKLPGKRWAEYLKKREPELEEEYKERFPYGIGGRPWAFQPKIKTVSF